MKSLPVLLLLCASTFGAVHAADDADARLVAAIAQIRAIDNHCHDEPAYAERGAGWKSEAPLGVPSYPDVAALRRDNPAWIRSWRRLYDYRFDDMSPEHVRALLDVKRKQIQKLGDAWPTYVLDRSGVDIALVNTTKLGAGQHSARFRWVPYADPILWPFSGDAVRLNFNGGGGSIAELMRDSGVRAVPPTLEQYEAQVIDPTLQRWKGAGAVAIKFMVAYARALDFAIVARATVAPLYAKAAAGTSLSAVEAKALEDFLFSDIAARAGALGLVVHIHTGNGNGPYFNNSDADPRLLEAAIGSRELRNTRFVLVHGGWPFHLTAQAMMDKPNTYADFSAQTFYLTPQVLADVLRQWLAWHPEKVLFGSDAYSDVDSPLSDYEEKQWLTTDNARRALAIALTRMMREGEISRARAVEIARGVLRENAVALYGLESGSRQAP